MSLLTTLFTFEGFEAVVNVADDFQKTFFAIGKRRIQAIITFRLRFPFFNEWVRSITTFRLQQYFLKSVNPLFEGIDPIE